VGPRVVVCVPSGPRGWSFGRSGRPQSRRGQEGLHHRGAFSGCHRGGAAGRGAEGSMVVDVGGGTTEVAVIS
jgi:hypothetical protein